MQVLPHEPFVVAAAPGELGRSATMSQLDAILSGSAGIEPQRPAAI